MDGEHNLMLFGVVMGQSARRSSTLNLRIPLWTSLNGGKATFNNENLPLPSPGSFLTLAERWNSNDSLALHLPISLRTEAIKDERPEYASIQAILFGPYLLAGLTSRDWDINASNSTLTEWITPIPASSRSQLVSISQLSSGQTFILSNSNSSLTMDRQPKAGTDDAIHATFRLILHDTKRSNIRLQKNPIGQSMMLEPFDLPGMVVVHQGPSNVLSVSPSTGTESVFKVVAGLDGKPNSVSFESIDHKGCFVSSDGADVKLECQGGGGRAGFREQTSFAMGRGLREYHPISFTAKGARRNFVLEPLLSLRDESYTVYFNIGT